MNDQHDPMPRKLDEEPYFSLMARDQRSPAFARLYAIVRERGPDVAAKAHAAVDALLAANAGIHPNPQKDKEHAWSARAKADEMAQWFRLNMQAKPQTGRVNAGAEHPEPPKPPKIERTTLSIGDKLVLIAPVHYRIETIPANDEDPIGQITSGTRGQVVEINLERGNYLAMMEGHPEQFHVVPFDRAALAI